MTESPAPKLKVGGTLGLEHLYIERTEDAAVFRHLANREYCSILTSRQMGKSSLMIRLTARLMDDYQARIASVDMAGDLGTPTDADDWYSGLLDKIALDLDLSTAVRQWWTEHGRGTPNQRLLQFFRDVVAADKSAPVVVFLDEIDATLKLPYSDDFFTAIRSMYNQRASVPQYEGLTFCLIGVATPGELIQDRRTTPYNVGHTIELRDFDPRSDDLTVLYKAMSYGAMPGEDIVSAVLDLTGGQPFLTIAVCSALLEARASTKPEIDKIVEALPSSTSDAIRSHLEGINTFLATRLTNEGATFRLYSSILRGRMVKDRVAPAHLELRLSGLIKRDAAGNLVMRNRIYAQRFGRAWLAQTRPMRYQARIYRIAFVLSLLLSVAVGFVVYTSQQGKKRRQATARLIEKLLSSKTEGEASSALSDICSDMRDNADDSDTNAERTASQNAWQAFWEARAVELDVESHKMFEAGDLERGLMLGALASVKRGKHSASFVEKYLTSNGPWLAATLRGHVGKVNKARLLGPDRIVSIGQDDTIRVFDLHTAMQLASKQVRGLSIALAPCIDGSCVVTGSNAGLSVWSPELAPIANVLFDREATLPGKLYAVAIDPSTPGAVRVAAGGESGIAQVGSLQASVMKPSSMLLHRARNNQPMPVYALAFTRDGHALVSAAWDGVRVFDLARDDGNARLIGEGHAFDVRASSTRVAFTLEPFTEAQREKISLPPSKEPETPVSVVYDLATNKQLSWFRGASLDVALFLTSVLSSDEKLVLNAARATNDNGLVIVWKVRDGEDGEKLFARETSAVLDAEFGPVAQTIVSSHADGLVRVWRLASDGRLPEDTQQAWVSIQTRFGLTVDGTGNIVPLGPKGASGAAGYTPSICGASYLSSPSKP